MSTKIDKTLILNRIKFHYGLKSNAELARFLGVSPQTISTWYTRNSIDYDLIFAKCVGLDANYLLGFKNEPNSADGNIEILSEPEKPATIYLAPQIITVDAEGEENIPYVPVRAAAGYLKGYKDSEYIERLPSLRLPGLRERTHRAFEVEGDSMYPVLENKEIVIGEWVEKIDYIREDRVHIVVTKNDGVVIKRLLNRVEKYGYIIAKSDAVNDRNLYPNIQIYPDDILEIWYAVWHGSFNFKAPGDLWKRQNNLEADVTEILRRLASLEQNNTNT